ncbi:Ig-like domain-containing protein [Pseudomonas juntendi]|uniref:Ig-like domain-containing protein n=2 Tax=Pseudomonas TaxID=286 RepID=UPI0034D7A462
MSIQAKVIASTQPSHTLADAPAVAVDGQLTLTQSSNVALGLSPDAVAEYSRQGPDLVVHLKNGETVRIANFYAEGQAPSELFLVGEDDKLVAVDLAAAETDGVVAATYVPQDGMAGFESLTAASGVAGVSGGALLASVAIVGGGIALASNGGGGGGGSDGGSTPDTVAPGRPTINPSNGSSFSGTAEPNSTVILTDGNGNPIGQTTADANGNWTFKPGTPLPDGTVVNVVAQDAAGNTSPGATITVDAVAPDAPVVNPTNGSTISGTAEPGSTVIITDGNGNPIGETTTDGNGNWTYTPTTPLPDGTVVNVVTKDPAGNTSGQGSVTVDAVAPDAPVVNPTNGSTLSGTAEPGSTVTLTDGNGNPIGQVTADGSGNWSFTPSTPLPNGTVVNATATDPSGNSSAPASTTVDGVAPATPTVNLSNGSSLSGTAEPGSKVIITDGSGNPIGETTADGSGNWTYTPTTPLPNGTAVNVVAQDAAGNTSPAAAVTVDSSAPAAPVVNPTNGTTLSGTAEPGSTVTLTDGNGNPIGQATADGSGNWSFTPSTPLPNGSVVNATATDPTGNTSGQGSVTVDAVAPSAPVLNPSNGTTLSGTAEPGSTVTLTDGNGNPIGQATADGSGNWSFTPGTALPDGTVVNATATDPSGNSSAPASTTVDAVAPAAPVVNPTNGNVINGTAEPDSTVTLTDGNGNPIGEVTADGSGNWTFTPATQLPNGTVVNATATDAAGNTGPQGTTTVDSSLPSIPQVDPSNGSVISGTADAGNTIIITDGNGNPVGQVTADGSGNWSFTPGAPLPDGTVINVVARNPANIDSAPAVITVDGVAPDAPVVEPSNGVDITGTAEAGATILLTDGNGNPIGQTTADGSGNWSFTPGTPLANGTVINAVAQDPAGNSSGPSSVTVDSVAPAAPVVNPTNGATLSGTAEPGSTVTLTDGNGNPIGETTADGSGNWSFTPATALPNGTVVNATATDPTGNTGPQGSTTVDSVAPAAPVVSPTNGVLVSGTAEPNSTITLTDGTGNPIGQVTADGAGNWSYTPATALPNGTVVNATATDAAGNVSGPGTTTVDTSVPNVPQVDASNGAMISGTADAGNLIIIRDGNGNPIGQTTADGSGNWTFTPTTALPDGTVVNVVARNPGNNIDSAPASITVDAVAPDAPVIEPSNGVELSGTAEPGATVLLLDTNGDPIGQATADGSGNWSFTPATPLPHGTVVEAVALDEAGNTSSPAAVTVDAVAPAAPVVNPSNGSTISGTAEPGSTVTLSDGNGNPIGEATADGSGNWTFTPAIALPDGTVINATATDPAGNTGPQGSATVDAIAPAAPTVNLSKGDALTGTAEPNSKVILTDGNGDPIGEATADGAGNWSFTPTSPIPNGTVVNVVAQDAAGNDSPPATVTVDASAPPAPVINPSNGTTISGTAEAGATVTLTDGGGNPIGQVTADGSGNWSYTPGSPLPNGTVIVATATDPTGNTGPQAATTVDAVAPAAPVIAPSNGTTLSGTAEAGAKVILTDGNGNPIGETTADGSGNWSFTPSTPLPNGTVVNAVAQDPAGNTGPQGSTTVDAVAPTAPVVNASNGNVVNGTAEPNSSITLTDGNGNPIGQTTTDGSGNWSFTPGTQLPNGTVVNVTATDAAGNVSVPSTTTVDTSLPSIPQVDPSNGSVISGTADAGNTIIITDGNGNPIGQVTADGSGNWSFTPGTPLPDGTVVNVVARNPGNVDSAPAVITVDGVAPNAPVVDPSNGTEISGTAEAGATVILTDGGGNPIGQTTADGNGDWSFTPTTPLANGTVINAVAQDPAGNTSGPTSVTVDTVAPPTPIINPTNGVIISGTAEAGATVILTDGNGNPIGEATADGSGNWSFTPGTPLPNGTVVNAMAEDAAGNTSGPASTTVDSVAPPAPLLSINADGTLLTGTAEPNSQVRIVVNGDTANPITVNVDGNGDFSWSPTSPLITGELLSAVTVDAAGNVSGPATITAPDLAPPTITVPEAADTWINAAEIGDGIQVDMALRPTMQAGQVVTVTFAGQNGYEASVDYTLTAGDIQAGNVTVTLTPPGGQGPFPEGASTVTAEVGGNASTPVAFTIDTVPPATPVLSLVGNILTISAEPGTELTITVDVGGVTATATATADNSGLASLNLLTDLDIDFSWDQLLNAQVSVVGRDPAGNPSNVATIGVGTSIEQPVTIGNFGLDVSLNPLDLRLGISGTTEPNSSVLVRVGALGAEVTLTPIQANANGDFNVNLLNVLPQLGIDITDILTGNTLLAVNLVATDANGNDSAAYGVTVGGNGITLGLGDINVNGTAGDDVLSGADGSSEHINGGAGHDLIFNVGSGDQVQGGDGNDTLQVTANNFVSIDGGAGFDTLLLANGIDLDYNGAGVGTLSNIERIDLGKGDSGSVLTLTAAEVDVITDANNTLQITGENNDTLNVVGAVNTGTTQLIDGVTYDVYTFGSTTLLIEDNTVQVVV